MRTNRILLPIIYSTIGGLVVLLASQYIGEKNVVRDFPTSSVQQVPVSMAAFTTSTGEITDFTYAAERTIHAVVHVKTKSTVNQYDYSYGNPLFDFFFGPQQRRPQQVSGAGSGVIITKDGYILTNNHVIDNVDNIEVVLNDKRTFDAKVVGRDPSTDMAVIRIEASDLPFITFGSSENLKVGEWVLAVGNPFNLNSTVTAGIVSAKARNINILSNQYAIESFIQTDAAVNPGNSGGALVNLKGELVGINTAIASQTGSFTGYSFAVPSTIAQKVALDIIEFGEVQRAILGINILEVNPKTAEDYNIKDLKGVLISGIVEKGAADEVGLKKGDVILQINGVEVNSPSQLQEQVSRYRPKDKIDVLVSRDGKTKLYQVVLRNLKGGFDVVKSKEVVDILGAELKEIDNNLKRRLNLNNGLQVTKLKDGALKEKGVKEGFIITRINRERVTTVQDVQQILSSTSGGVLIEGVYPNGLVAYYAIGI